MVALGGHVVLVGSIMVNGTDSGGVGGGGAGGGVLLKIEGIFGVGMIHVNGGAGNKDHGLGGGGGGRIVIDGLIDWGPFWLDFLIMGQVKVRGAWGRSSLYAGVGSIFVRCTG